MDDRLYWLGFSVFSGIGPARFHVLLQRFGSAKDAWEADLSDLEKAGLGGILSRKFDRFRKEFSLPRYVKKLEGEGVSFLILTDEAYPKSLREIQKPPFVLYVKGDGEILRGVYTELVERAQNDRVIAVVGTRKTTHYGREVTRLLTQELVAAEFTIVSGLAIGVDAIAHLATIENNGKTIAVLGCGVDCCFPRENMQIYNQIVKTGGAIVSELPLSTAPSKGSFPARNRIIAGLSLGVVVTEGAEDSGALITASNAATLGRPVFAVPGPITSSMSKGPYKLIAKGAKLVTRAEDILEELSIRGIKSTKGIKGRKKIKGETEEEQVIIDLLQHEPLHFDEIVRTTGWESAKVGSVLSIMEVKGVVKSLDGGFFGL